MVPETVIESGTVTVRDETGVKVTETETAIGIAIGIGTAAVTTITPERDITMATVMMIRAANDGINKLKSDALFGFVACSHSTVIPSDASQGKLANHSSQVSLYRLLPNDLPDFFYEHAAYHLPLDHSISYHLKFRSHILVPMSFVRFFTFAFAYSFSLPFDYLSCYFQVVRG